MSNSDHDCNMSPEDWNRDRLEDRFGQCFPDDTAEDALAAAPAADEMSEEEWRQYEAWVTEQERLHGPGPF